MNEFQYFHLRYEFSYNSEVVRCDFLGCVGGYQHYYPEDGGDMFLQSVGNQLQDYMASQPR
jgi:hypothetical protein